MQSPFPGLDPYLEGSSLWPDVHHGLISEMQAVLNRQLRPQYHVRVEERVYISDENDPGRKAIVPDLGQKRGQEPIAKWPGGCSALLVPDPFSELLILTTLIEDEIHEARLEVIDTNQQAVVTVIELLSPPNKIHGSRGRASYEQKRGEVMNSSSHFVEIDLLREGVLPAGSHRAARQAGILFLCRCLSAWLKRRCLVLRPQ